MKKRILWHSGLFILCSIFLNEGKLKAQFAPVVQWATTYDHIYGGIPSHASDWIYNTINTDGGSNYVAVGYTWTGSDASGACDDPSTTWRCAHGEIRTPVAYKLDYAGNVINTATVDDLGGACGNNGGNFQGVVELDDGGYVACGTSTTSLTSPSSIIVTYLDPSTFTPTTYYFRNVGTDSYRGYAIQKVYKLNISGQPEEDGFIISGVHVNYLTDANQAYLLRIDKNFAFVWDQTINGSYQAINNHVSNSTSVAPLYYYGTLGMTTVSGKVEHDFPNMSSGSYVAAGHDFVIGFVVGIDQVNSSMDNDVLIIKTDANGNVDAAANDNTWESDIDYTPTNEYTATYNYANALSWTPSSSVTNTYSRFQATGGTSGFMCSSPGSEMTAISYSSPSKDDKNSSVGQAADGSIVVTCEFNVAEPGCESGSCFPLEYKDAEAIMIKWDYGSSSTSDVNTGKPSQVKMIDHCGGGDYKVKWRQVSNGNFVVSYSTADYEVLHAVNSSDVSEAVLEEVDGSFNTVWKKPINSTLALGDAYACAFNVTLTDDNGYIICGNDVANGDDGIFIKLGGECQDNTTISTNVFSVPLASGTYTGMTGVTYYVTSNWTVPSGISITLNNYHLQFLDTYKNKDFYDITSSNTLNFVVSTNASLTLTDCNLTGYVGCNGSTPDMWDGLVVVGSSSLSQTTANQGTLILQGTTIEYARTGVMVGTSNAYANGGGMLFAEDDGSGNHTYFTNNRYGISFAPYSYSSSNVSWVKGCQFDCNAPLADYGNQGTDKHVFLNACSGVAFRGNTFNNTGTGYECTGKGTGIYSYNSGLDINTPATTPYYYMVPYCSSATTSLYGLANNFNGLEYGISFTGTGTYTTDADVWLCQFSDVKQGITVDGNSAPVFGMNYFTYDNNMPSNPFTWVLDECPADFAAYSCIRIMNCPQYMVTNNRLSIPSTVTTAWYFVNGVWASHSGTSSSSPYSNILYNEFKNQSPMTVFGSTCSTCAGVATTGIRIDDPVGDYAKYINIYHNGQDNSLAPTLIALSPTVLNNMYDIYIDDPGFTQTPIYSLPQLGVDNFFSTGNGSSYPYNTLVNQIYNNPSNPIFTYYGVTSADVPNTAPGGWCNNVGGNPVILKGDLFPGSDYCMNAGVVMPSAPERLNNNDGNAMEQENQLTTDNSLINSKLSLIIIPNPFLNAAEIRYSIPVGDGNANLDIFDGLGRNIEIIALNCTQTELTLNANGLKPGLYYYTLTTTNNNKLIGKFVVANP